MAFQRTAENTAAKGKKGVRLAELQRRDKDLKKLEQDFNQEKKKYDELVARFVLMLGLFF